MKKYKILKLRADRIINFSYMSENEINEYNVSYRIDLDKELIYGVVVEEQLLMENCALFDQFRLILNKEESKESIREWLLQELVIVDFTNIYKKTTDIPEDSIKNLITKGFIMRYMDKDVHMLPFDKSGNMSRRCRLSFINVERLDIMNERLNIGIDFSRIRLKLSKYYAYRGLYLSTARRIQNDLLKLTPETLIIIDDNQDKMYYMKDVSIVKGIPDENDCSKIRFEHEKVEKEKITVPFDGLGVISPTYADWINEELENTRINSFQIRLPFSKGMLHRVDFHAFLREFDSAYKADTYVIRDAFGIERDLKLANIIMTKSMFKCFDWIKEFCGDETDPMEFYCGALEKYSHALYVSSTDLPYGGSKVTHISYQLLNTLKLTDKQFQSLIKKQLDYIHNPIRYIEMTQGQCVDENEEENPHYGLSNWQKALLMNPSFGNLIYIKNQLKNIQAALMTKLALGKLVVKGQTRYMARDLPFMLVNLIQNKDKREKLKDLKIFYYRFFLPQGNQGKDEMGLDYYTYYGFFRSPHLSRNEQGLLAPMIENKQFDEKYNNECETIHRYFGHLTGVIMFGNESLEPMALGGADFDGDLVTMIMDSDIVDAIKDGVYKKGENGSLDWQRELPYIKIPSLPAKDEFVPELIPYQQIKNTFSNRIGLISNAAIAIGQFEYGNKKETYRDENMKCWCCTILTGLEIDAAKNGVHPDLGLLSVDESLATCSYLEFKKKFEKLKTHRSYHFNQLYAEKAKGKYTLSLKNTKKTIDTIEYIEEEGTYINKLPIIFMENLNPELNIPNMKKKEQEYFHFPAMESDKQREKLFEEQCDTIFRTYKYYTDLLAFIQDEIKAVNYGELNIRKLLKKQYDSESADKIIKEDLPYLFGQIANRISSYTDLKNIEKKINQEKWHLMNVDDKKKFLCETLETVSLEENRWSVVLQPYNHNYKILWYIVHGYGSRKEYSSIKDKFNKLNKNRPEITQIHPHISKQAELLLRNYLENKEADVPIRIYSICLRNLKDMVQDFDLPVSRKIEILFKITKDKIQRSRFFWECFEWEELEPYIVKEEGHAE